MLSPLCSEIWVSKPLLAILFKSLLHAFSKGVIDAQIILKPLPANVVKSD